MVGVPLGVRHERSGVGVSDACRTGRVDLLVRVSAALPAREMKNHGESPRAAWGR
jgi:hypothetical protein